MEEEKFVQDHNVDLGPLNKLMLNDRISDVLVNGCEDVFVEKEGRLYQTDVSFDTEEQLMEVIENILRPLGKRVSEENPMCDGRLPDGSRVNIVIPPITLEGAMISIRKFTKKKLTMTDLLRFNSISEKMAKFLKLSVVARKNIIVSGGTGSGKTTLLNILSSFIPEGARIITIEDAAELQLHKDHIGRLESRPPDIDGKGEIKIRHLVINALRMRPDRIIVGECRGGEALDMLQAMNTGHDGSLTTIHANAPRDMLNRLETMVLMAGMDLPTKAIRDQIMGAVDLIVHVSRYPGGSRKVNSIMEVTGMEGNVITMAEIFKFKQTGIEKGQKVVGEFKPTGVIPTYLNDMRELGMDVDMGIFKKKK
ncbi:MAG: CpaF family protein [Elusimicrobiota bacterium]